MDNNDNQIQVLKNLWNRENFVGNPSEKIPLTKAIIDQVANVFSAGEFYYCVFDLESYELDYMSDSVEDVLGIKPAGFGLEEMLSYFHPEDIERMKEKEMASMEFKFNRIPLHQIKDYKTVYLFRYLLPDKRVKTILHQAKTLNVSKDGKIQQTFVVHTDVTYLNIPIDQKISFISDIYPSYYSLDPSNLVLQELSKTNIYTGQEIKILKHIANGKTSGEISHLLYISETTVKKHRQNILKKSEAKNITHLIATCIRDGII